MVGEVSALEHELGDHTVEGAAFVPESLLARSQRSEIGGRPGDVSVKELEDNASHGLAVGSDVEENVAHFDLVEEGGWFHPL